MNGHSSVLRPDQDRPAPFHSGTAQTGPDAFAVWREASDGMILRAGVLSRGDKGTVLLLQGRTEYLEKYGPPANRLSQSGYTVASIDFRGQGLSEGRLDDRSIGHVERFSDYQIDVEVLVDLATELDLPRPWFLIGHSLGGAVALRALLNGLDVNAAVFSAPLWGINMSVQMQPVAWSLGLLANQLQLNTWVTPGTSRLTYVREAEPEDNFLTTDHTVLARMRAQLDAQPKLELGGPNVPWLYRALVECRELRRAPPPDVPSLTFVPEHEEIVRADFMRDLSDRWPNGAWLPVVGGKHETMMESPERQDFFFKETAAFFARHAG